MSEVKTCRIPTNKFANIAAGLLIVVGLVPIMYAFSVFDHNTTTPVWAAVLAAIGGIGIWNIGGLIIRASSSIITVDDQGIRVSDGLSIAWSENPVLIDGIKVIVVRMGIPTVSQQKHTIISPNGVQISWKTGSTYGIKVDREAVEVLDFARQKTQGNVGLVIGIADKKF